MAEFPTPSFLENQSMDEIHKRMMELLPANIDNSEGSHQWNLTRPTAYVAALTAEYLLPEAIKLIFPRYCEDYPEVMDDHAECRALRRKAATAASGYITITGKAGTEIPADSAFSTASVNGEPAIEFVTTETVTIGEDGTVYAPVQAVETGTIGNVAAGTIIMKANKITGITSVTNEEALTGGTVEETTESLQERIIEYDAAEDVSYVGTEADYKRWTLEVDGTGNAVIVPAQDESGLITIILTDSNGDPANETLREAVYNHILRPDEPTERKAGINGGNIVVVAPENIAITISVTIELNGVVAPETIEKSLLDTLKTYMAEAAAKEEVQYAEIGSIIKKTNGVEDYKDLLLNGGTTNIPITKQQLPTIDKEGLAITVGSV